MWTSHWQHAVWIDFLIVDPREAKVVARVHKHMLGTLDVSNICHNLEFFFLSQHISFKPHAELPAKSTVQAYYHTLTHTT